MVPNIPGWILSALDSIDNLRKRNSRDEPVFDVRYLRSEGDDENFNHGALKLKISNQSDQKFTVDAVHIRSINGYENFTESGDTKKLEIQPQDFENVRLEFRYRGKNIFNEGENTAIINYHLESAKESSWSAEEVFYEDNSDIDTI